MNKICDRCKTKFTSHAKIRSAERNIPLSQVEKVIAWGCTEYRAGLCFHLMRTRDLPKEFYKQLKNLVGLVVITNQEGKVVTCYKSNPQALHRIRKLKKYHYPRSRPFLGERPNITAESNNY